MTGFEKIMAAAQADLRLRAISGPQKIFLAATMCQDPDAIPGPTKIRIVASSAMQLAVSDGAGVAKILRAAGHPVDGDQPLAKAAALGVLKGWQKSPYSHMGPLDSLIKAIQLPRQQARRGSRRVSAVGMTSADVPSVLRQQGLRFSQHLAAAPVGADWPRRLPFDHPFAYWDFRDRLARALREGRVQPTARAMVDHARAHYALSSAEAAEWTVRFFTHLQRGLQSSAQLQQASR